MLKFVTTKPRSSLGRTQLVKKKPVPVIIVAKRVLDEGCNSIIITALKSIFIFFMTYYP